MNWQKLFLVLIVAQVTTTAEAREIGCKKAKIFRKNKSYLYGYHGIVENGIKWTSENSTQLRISADVHIDHVFGCEYAMQMRNVRLEESFGGTGRPVLSPASKAASQALERFPVHFVIDNGLIKAVRPVLKERERALLNIKRGVLSSFQVNWSKRKSIKEVDVSGGCHVSYKISRQRDGSKNVVKIKDLASCDGRSMAHSNIDTFQYKKMSSIYEGSSLCRYLLGKKNEVRSAICSEFYLMKPFSSSLGAGTFTNISKSVVLKQIKRTRHRKRSDHELYSTSLLFTHKHDDEFRAAGELPVIKLLGDLVDNSAQKVLPETSSLFTELVAAMRYSTEKALREIMEKLHVCFDRAFCETKRKSYWAFFLEALSQCGSTACVNIIGGLATSQTIPGDKVDDFITALNFVKEPSPEMLNTIMGIYKSTQNHNALLLLGTLMHKICRHRPLECNGKGLIGSVIQEAEFLFIRLLGNDCRVKDEGKQELMFYSLKAIGNAGRPVRMKNVIIDCVRHATEARISVAALHALRRMSLDRGVADQLRMLLIDRNVDLEKRIESLLLLLKTPTEDDILLSIDMVNDEREAHQMRSFISSYLKSFERNSNPLKYRVAGLIKKLLQKRKMAELYSPASRFSKAFDKSFYLGPADIGAGIHGYTIFHPESFIPRTAKLGIEAQVLGHSVDVLSISARMEGLERYVEKIFGDSGYFSKYYLKKFFDIPKNFASKKKVSSRTKRNAGTESFWDMLKIIDKQVNMKESHPQIDLTFSVFGNDVRILKLKDIRLLNGGLDDFNVLQTLYSLTKGRAETFRKSFIFLEGSYSVPTILGMPLNFDVNSSAILSLHMDGKVSVNNLIVGPKGVHMKGLVLPSVSLAVSGKVAVDGYFTEVGLRLNSSAYTAVTIGGAIDYEEGKLFEANIDAPAEKVDLFSYRHEIFHIVGRKEIRIAGSPRRTNLSLCTDEVYNSSQIFGVDACSELSFPVAYQSISAPYYPLTGPASARFQLHKKDKSLYFYHLQMARKKDFLQVNFGTPGAKNPRMNKMNLALMPSGLEGIVGATFGNTNRGLLLKYRYNNESRGLEAELISNITKVPMVLSTRYFNETNSVTLDAKMGLEVQLVSGASVTQTYLHFTDTYSYWGFKWLFKHQKIHIDAELKVAYNPQAIFISYNYGKKTFALQLVPSFPIFSFDVLVNWQPKYYNLTLRGDVNKGRLEVTANTTTCSLGAIVALSKNRGYKEFLFSINRGSDVYQWLNKLDYRNKIVQSQMVFKGKKYGITSVMKRNKFTVSVDGMQAFVGIGAVETLHERGLNLTWNFGAQLGQLLVFFNGNGHRQWCAQAKLGYVVRSCCFRSLERGKYRSVEIAVRNGESVFTTSLSNTKEALQSDPLSYFNIFMMRMKMNDDSIFDSKVVLASNSAARHERLSSVLASLARDRFTLDLQMPSFDVLGKKMNTSGCLKLRQNTLQGTSLALLDLSQVWKAKQGKSEIVFDANLVRADSEGADILAFSEKVVLNENQELNKLRRQFLTRFRGTSHLFQDQLTLGHNNDGTIKWDAKYWSGKATPEGNGEKLVRAVKDSVQKMKPSAYATVEVTRGSRGCCHLSKFDIVLLEHSVRGSVDLEEGMALFNATFPRFMASFDVLFGKQEEYVITLRYTNGSLAMEQGVVTITKSNVKGYWEVEISHPKVRNIITLLNSVYRSGHRDYEEGLMKVIANVSRNMKFSGESKTRILKSIVDLVEKLVHSANTSESVSSLPARWKTWLQIIWSELSLQAVNALSNRETQNTTELDFSELRGRVDYAIKNIMLGYRDAVPSFEPGNQAWGVFRDSVAELLGSVAFRASILKALQRAMVMLNVSSEARIMILSKLERVEDGKKNSPGDIFFMYRNISNILLKEILQDRAPIALKYLRSKVKETLPQKAQIKMLRAIQDAEKSIISKRVNSGFTLTDTIGELMKFEVVIHRIVAEIIKEEVRNARLPNPIKRAISQFAGNLAYKELFTDVLVYVSDTLNLTRRHPTFVQKLLANDRQGLLVIVVEVLKDKNIPEPVRQPFFEYLVSLNSSELVRGLLNATSSSKMFPVDLYQILSDILLLGSRIGKVDRGEALARLNTLLMALAATPGNKTLVRSFLRSAHSLTNVPPNGSYPFASLLATRKYLDAFFKEVLLELKGSTAMHAFFNRLEKDLNMSDAIKDQMRFAKLAKNSPVGEMGQENAFAVAKGSLMNVVSAFAYGVPYPWKSRLQPMLTRLLNEIKMISEERFVQNTTKVLFNVGDRVWQPIRKYLAQNLSADITKDLKSASEILAARVSLGNVSVSDALERVSKRLQDRFHFLLRIVAQIFPNLVPQFELRYFQGDNFITKMYQDFLDTNVTSPSYVDRTKTAFDDLATKMLMELQNATGGYSTGTGILNLMKFLNGLNLTSFDSAVASFEKVKGMKYTNWSLPDLLNYWKDIVKTIGHMRIGNATVSRHLQPLILDFRDILPQMILRTESIANKVVVILDNSTTYVKRFKLMLHDTLNRTLAKMKFGFTNWPKLLKFVSDMLVPVVGTTRHLFNMAPERHLSHVPKSTLARLHAFWMQFDRLNFTADFVTLVETVSGESIEQSIQSLLRKGAAVFDEAETRLLKQLRVFKQTVLEAQEELESLLKKTSRFLKFKAGRPLHKLVHKSSKHIYSYLNATLHRSTFYHNLEAEVRRFSQVNVLSKKFDAALRHISDSLGRAVDVTHPQVTKKWAQTVVPSLIRNGSFVLTREAVRMLAWLEKKRLAAIRSPFLRDPQGYIQSLPKRVAFKMQEILLLIKPKIFKWMSDVERMMKDRLLNGVQLFHKLQSDSTHAILKGEMLADYIAALGRHQKHRKGQWIIQLRQVIDSLVQFSSIGNRSEQRESCYQLWAVRLSCLARWQELLPKNAENGTVDFTAFSLKIAEREKKYFDFEKAVIKNITASIYNFKGLTENVSAWIEQEVSVQSALLLRANQTMRDIAKVLQSIERDLHRHVRRKNGTSVFILVPEFKKLKEQVSQVMTVKKNPPLEVETAYFASPQSTAGHLYSLVVHQMGMNTANSSVPSLDATEGMSKAWEVSYAALQRAFFLGRGGVNDAIVGYRAFTDDIGSRSDFLAQQTYNRTFRDPLKWLSSIATIPVPGEKLRTFLDSEDIFAEARRAFAPVEESATFFNNHIFSYDGGYLYLPTVQNNGPCMYLLARDFRRGAFTIVYAGDHLLIFIGQTKISFSRAGKVVITAMHDGKEAFTSDLPSITPDVVAKSFGNTFTVSSRLGLQVHCNQVDFMCNFLLSGMYHNKTLGLFGTNNVESADELRLPNGKISIDVVPFINSWEISGQSTCRALRRDELLPACKVHATSGCARLFKNHSSPLSSAFKVLRPFPYFMACRQEASMCSKKTEDAAAVYCPIAVLYMKRASQLGIKLTLPEECVTCHDIVPMKSPPMQQRQQPVDFVFVVRESAQTTKALKNLKYAMNELDHQLRRINVDPRYALVGFDGLGHRSKPFVQTGRGAAPGDIDDLIAAVNNLECRNPRRTASGLMALQFAANLAFRASSTKIFVILDTLAVYSGALKELIQTNKLLNGKGIILNSINNYRFRKHVIGKDSFNTRYHLKIPNGEVLRMLTIHTADDYVPLVKESRGGVMALKSLTSFNEKWMKAFPISFKRMIVKQLQNDAAQCKSCSCVLRSDGFREEKCTRSRNC